MISATLDPRTGWPVAHRRSATALAPRAIDADALATAMLVLSPEAAAAALAPSGPLAGRMTHEGGVDWIGGQAPAQWRQGAAAPSSQQDAYQSGWPPGWTANITFTAPPKDMRREIAFRSPYVAIWVSDANRRTVRTLLLIGSIKEWQESNHIWWRLNKGATTRLLDSRSMSTRGSGIYKVFWDGVDDEGRPVPPGTYTFHVETSRERGGHEHRTLEVDFSTTRPFEAELPVEAATGGLLVAFQKF